MGAVDGGDSTGSVDGVARLGNVRVGGGEQLVGLRPKTRRRLLAATWAGEKQRACECGEPRQQVAESEGEKEQQHDASVTVVYLGHVRARRRPRLQQARSYGSALLAVHGRR